MVGQRFHYLSEDWLLIDVLQDQDALVLQRQGNFPSFMVQADQYGQAQRRTAETLTLAISDKNDPDSYNDAVLLLLEGRQRD